MAGTGATFIFEKSMFMKWRLLNRLLMRFDAKHLVKDLHTVTEDLNLEEAAAKIYNLTKVNVLDHDLLKRGDDAVKQFFHLTTEIYLFVDALIGLLPDTKLIVKYLTVIQNSVIRANRETNPLPETRRKNEQLIVAIERAKIGLKKYREQVMTEIEKDSHDVYKDYLNIIAAVAAKDRKTFMEKAVTTFKTNGDGLIEYIALRQEINSQLKDYSRARKFSHDIARLTKDLKDAARGSTLKPEDVMDYLELVNKSGEGIFDEIKEGIKKGFKAAIRASICMFTLVGVLTELNRNEEWRAQNHAVPMQMALIMEEEIRNIDTKLSNDLHYEIKALHTLVLDAKEKQAVEV